MNRSHQKQRDFADTLILLCKARGGNFLRAGNVNGSEIARIAGTKQPNVSRWLRKEYHPLDENVKKLAKAFNVSPAQMRGEAPINELDGIKPQNPEDQQFYDEYQSLAEEDKHVIREMVRVYKTRGHSDA